MNVLAAHNETYLIVCMIAEVNRVVKNKSVPQTSETDLFHILLFHYYH